MSKITYSLAEYLEREQIRNGLGEGSAIKKLLASNDFSFFRRPAKDVIDEIMSKISLREKIYEDQTVHVECRWDYYNNRQRSETFSQKYSPAPFKNQEKLAKNYEIISDIANCDSADYYHLEKLLSLVKKQKAYVEWEEWNDGRGCNKVHYNESLVENPFQKKAFMELQGRLEQRVNQSIVPARRLSCDEFSAIREVLSESGKQKFFSTAFNGKKILDNFDDIWYFADEKVLWDNIDLYTKGKKEALKGLVAKAKADNVPVMMKGKGFDKEVAELLLRNFYCEEHFPALEKYIEEQEEKITKNTSARKVLADKTKSKKQVKNLEKNIKTIIGK
ncbi:MAG: hypothetical protein FWE47_02940 [Oscillospiraceae bacterium]|nr:hypothetical protein [Oscillospiraceae bacterium]